MNISPVTHMVQRALREIGCIHRFTYEGNELTAAVPFKIIFGPEGRGYVIEILRADLPPSWGFKRFERQLPVLESKLGSPLGVYLCDDLIVIADPVTECEIRKDLFLESL